MDIEKENQPETSAPNSNTPIEKLTEEPNKLSPKIISIQVVECVKKLQSKKGVSSVAIKNYVIDNFQGEDALKCRMLVTKCLKKAVLKGELINVSGSGASGSFKLPTVIKPKSKKVLAEKQMKTGNVKDIGDKEKIVEQSLKVKEKTKSKEKKPVEKQPKNKLETASGGQDPSTGNVVKKPRKTNQTGEAPKKAPVKGNKSSKPVLDSEAPTSKAKGKKIKEVPPVGQGKDTKSKKPEVEKPKMVQKRRVSVHKTPIQKKATLKVKKPLVNVSNSNNVKKVSKPVSKPKKNEEN